MVIYLLGAWRYLWKDIRTAKMLYNRLLILNTAFQQRLFYSKFGTSFHFVIYNLHHVCANYASIFRNSYKNCFLKVKLWHTIYKHPHILEMKTCSATVSSSYIPLIKQNERRCLKISSCFLLTRNDFV